MNRRGFISSLLDIFGITNLGNEDTKPKADYINNVSKGLITYSGDFPCYYCDDSGYWLEYKKSKMGEYT